MSESTKPIMACVARACAALENGLLDGHRSIEDVVDQPLLSLRLAAQATETLPLAPGQGNGVPIIGDIQRRLASMITAIHAVCPRQAREMTLREGTPQLIAVIEAVPAVLDLLKQLDQYTATAGEHWAVSV